MTEGKRKQLKFGIILLAVLIIAKVAYDLRLFDVLWGIFRLETTKARVSRVSLKTHSFVTHADDEEAFIDEMESLGWKYTAKYGRGMVFENAGYEVLMTKHTYFGMYTFYEGNTEIK